MSYDFWVDLNAAGDLGSGCTESLSPDWSGTVDVSGMAVTAVTGGNFPTVLFDGKHFLRLDPDGAGDANIRIASGGTGSLTLAETGGTRTGVTANIGGAFKTPEKAVGSTAGTSKIPYANGTSINDAINIWIKPGTYTLSAGLKIASATQDAAYLRRTILGVGGFADGVFGGPILDGTGLSSTLVDIQANSVTVAKMKGLTAAGKQGVSLLAGKFNAGLYQIYLSGGLYGYYGGVGSSANTLECLFEDVTGTAIGGENMTVEQSVVKGCYRAFAGKLSSFIGCVEYNTGLYLFDIDPLPGCSDFSWCHFTSNKGIRATGQVNVSNCVFDYNLNLSGVSKNVTLRNSVVGGQFVAHSKPDDKVFPVSSNLRVNSGIGVASQLFSPAINFELHYPDPTLDKYCRYTTAGPHEYRFPVEAVGARALRNRTRVTTHEIGL